MQFGIMAQTWIPRLWIEVLEDRANARLSRAEQREHFSSFPS